MTCLLLLLLTIKQDELYLAVQYFTVVRPIGLCYIIIIITTNSIYTLELRKTRYFIILCIRRTYYMLYFEQNSNVRIICETLTIIRPRFVL